MSYEISCNFLVIWFHFSHFQQAETLTNTSHPSHEKEYASPSDIPNLSKPTVYVMHQQFNIQQLYALPTLYLCVLYLSENKQRLASLTA
jgi:hypothetical protein